MPGKKANLLFNEGNLTGKKTVVLSWLSSYFNKSNSANLEKESYYPTIADRSGHKKKVSL
jgi:hypothetical protein